jgi:hypothetical protein
MVVSPRDCALGQYLCGMSALASEARDLALLPDEHQAAARLRARTGQRVVGGNEAGREA